MIWTVAPTLGFKTLEEYSKYLEMEKEDILIQIKDNGIGCKEMKSGFGTKHMKERIRMLNGAVTFDGSDGFMVNARIPIRRGETYD